MNPIIGNVLWAVALLMTALTVSAEMDAPATEIDVPATETDIPAAEMFPLSGTLPGWLLTEEPKQFPAEDLWQHINGAADQYLSFGCTTLTVGYYRQEDGEPEITVEIYRMQAAPGSFGLYALERPPKGPFMEIGAQGYQVGGDLNFFGGSYYIKLRAYPQDKAVLEAERKLAGIIAGKHLVGSTLPVELGLFPRENLVESSFGLVPRAVLGLQGLSNALVARYRAPDHSDDRSQAREMALHLVREKNPETAKAAFSAVRESLSKRSIVPLRQVTIGTADGVQGELKYHGPVLLLRSGRDVLLGAGASNQDWVHKTISLLLANLAR